MALVYLLFVLDRPEFRLLVILIYDSEDSVHSFLALDRFLLLLPKPPGQVRPVQKLG